MYAIYDYRKNVTEDVKNAIIENIDNYKGMRKDDLEATLNNDLWVDDSVTGNGSGSYTFNRHEAKFLSRVMAI